MCLRLLNSPESARVTPGGAKRVGPAPKCQALHLRRVRDGNRNPEGGEAEAEERRAAGRRIGPEAVTGQEAGYRTADTCTTKVFICVLAKKAYRHRDAVRVAADASPETTRKQKSSTDGLCRIALVCRRNSRRNQMERSSRVGSKNRHDKASRKPLRSSSQTPGRPGTGRWSSREGSQPAHCFSHLRGRRRSRWRSIVPA
jgi:hypothetical protein